MCGGGRHGRRQDAIDMRARLQQASVAGPAAGHARAHGMGDRPVPHLQGRARTLVGGGGQCQCQPASLGHLRRPRKRQTVRLRTFRCGKYPSGHRTVLLKGQDQTPTFQRLPDLTPTHQKGLLDMSLILEGCLLTSSVIKTIWWEGTMIDCYNLF